VIQKMISGRKKRLVLKPGIYCGPRPLNGQDKRDRRARHASNRPAIPLIDEEFWTRRIPGMPGIKVGDLSSRAHKNGWTG